MTIKLPVQAVDGDSGRIEINDSDGILLCPVYWRYQADQIEISLNCHDALREALKFYALEPSECRNRLNPDLPGTRNDWSAEIGHDSGDIARAALSKVEDLRKNQHQTNTNQP